MKVDDLWWFLVVVVNGINIGMYAVILKRCFEYSLIRKYRLDYVIRIENFARKQVDAEHLMTHTAIIGLITVGLSVLLVLNTFMATMQIRHWDDFMSYNEPALIVVNLFGALAFFTVIGAVTMAVNHIIKEDEGYYDYGLQWRDVKKHLTFEDTPRKMMSL